MPSSSGSDLVNGLFELGGALAVWLSIREVRRDKAYAGLSPWQVLFFQVWGLWNIYFYPTLNQPWSTAGGLALATANTVYLYYLWRYRHVRTT
jgi:hypothetical protein